MGTRRGFLQGTAAFAIASATLDKAATASAVESALRPFPQSMVMHRVIADARFTESRQYADAAQRLGQTIYITGGDITRFWTEQLSEVWRFAPVPIAGMTAHGPLFCLERWGWDRGLRVVLRIDHQRSAGGCLTHRVQAADAERLRTRLSAAGAGYPAVAARASVEQPAGSFQVLPSSAIEWREGNPEPLISWVIAPLRSG